MVKLDTSKEIQINFDEKDKIEIDTNLDTAEPLDRDVIEESKDDLEEI